MNLDFSKCRTKEDAEKVIKLNKKQLNGMSASMLFLGEQINKHFKE